jgi:hypothetical protein
VNRTPTSGLSAKLARKGQHTLPPAALRVLAAVCDIYGRRGRCTIRQIAAALRLRGPAHVLALLIRLRGDGLIAYEYGKCGTIRPTCRFFLEKA